MIAIQIEKLKNSMLLAGRTTEIKEEVLKELLNGYVPDGTDNEDRDWEPAPINPDDYEKGLDLKSGGINKVIEGQPHRRKRGK